MTPPEREAVEAARTLVDKWRRDVGAWDVPEKDYYEDKDYANLIQAIADHTEAALKEKEAKIKLWKEMGDKEHALAVQFAKEADDLRARLAAAEGQLVAEVQDNDALRRSMNRLTAERDRQIRYSMALDQSIDVLVRERDALKTERDRVRIDLQHQCEANNRNWKHLEELRAKRNALEAAVEQARGALLHISVTSSRYRSHSGSCQADCTCDAIMDDKLVKTEIGRVVQPALAALTASAPKVPTETTRRQVESVLTVHYGTANPCAVEDLVEILSVAR